MLLSILWIPYHTESKNMTVFLFFLRRGLWNVLKFRAGASACLTFPPAYGTLKIQFEKAFMTDG